MQIARRPGSPTRRFHRKRKRGCSRKNKNGPPRCARLQNPRWQKNAVAELGGVLGFLIGGEFIRLVSFAVWKKEEAGGGLARSVLSFGTGRAGKRRVFSSSF